MEIHYHPIGVIHSPFKDLNDMPIQPTGYASGEGHIEVYPQFAEGLKDLEGFSHIYILYNFHRIHKPKLIVTPYMVDEPHGIFATRAPSRPNPIGLSVVKLKQIDGWILYVEQIDVLDGTPLLDIKPYVPEFESTDDVQIGWLNAVKGKVQKQKSDDRFR